MQMRNSHLLNNVMNVQECDAT